MERDISVPVLEVPETSSVRLPCISIARESQSGLSSSDERLEMSYMIKDKIKADTPVKFLDRFENKTGSNMAHKTEKHLQYVFTKKQVCDIYVTAFESIY